MASIDKNLFNNNNNLSTTSFRTRIMGLQKNNLIKLKSNKSVNIFAYKSLSKSNSLNFNAISSIEERLSFLKNFPLIFIFLNNTPKKTQIYFQESGSLLMNELISFHDDVMCLITFIVIFVLYTLLAFIINFFVKDSLAFKKYIKKYEANYNSTLEIIWTIIPSVILLIIVIPSFSLLHFISNDRIKNNEPSFVVKIIGHQRYWWTYEYFDFNGNSITFDSYLLPIDELILGSFRNSDEDDLEYFFNCCVKKEQEAEYVEFDEEDGDDVWDSFFSKPKDKPVLEELSEEQKEAIKKDAEERAAALSKKKDEEWLTTMFIMTWVITGAVVVFETLLEVVKEFTKK